MKEIRFSSAKEALQHLADVTGKRIKISFDFGSNQITIDDVADAFNCEDELAEEIVSIIQAGGDEETVLQKVNDLLRTAGYGAFGVESARVPHENNGQDPRFKAKYINTGDSYSGTILYDDETDKYYVTTWEDWVESAEMALEKEQESQ